MTPEALRAREAVEALRSGVPSRPVVQEVGTTHTEVEDAFLAALEKVRSGAGTDPVACTATFGGGKTHLLIHLREMAERAGFATSLVVVSPETPLGNPGAVLSEICRNASVAGRVGDALRELQADARTDSDEWAEFRLWARDTGVIQRFQAQMYLYEEMQADVDFRVRILEDVQGKAMPLSEIRQALKELRQASAYDLRGTPRARALVPERIRLLARWFRAFGKHGLVVFFDELERLGNFTRRQRMAAYEQVAWWTEAARSDGTALLPVWFATDGLDAAREEDRLPIMTAVLGGANPEATRTTVPQLLQISPLWRGWKALDGLALLQPPGPEELRSLQSKVAAVYERAYGLERVADLPIQPHPDTVRQEIRRWIAYWDMQRLYPGYTPDIAVGHVEMQDGEEWSDDLAPEAGNE